MQQHTSNPRKPSKLLQIRIPTGFSIHRGGPPWNMPQLSYLFFQTRVKRLRNGVDSVGCVPDNLDSFVALEHTCDNRAVVGRIVYHQCLYSFHRRISWFLLVCGLLLFLPGFFTIPPIDRDEARFAQATKQMVESGDYVDIRFQDDVRYKKPVGIYWLQSAAVETASATTAWPGRPSSASSPATRRRRVASKPKSRQT